MLGAVEGNSALLTNRFYGAVCGGKSEMVSRLLDGKCTPHSCAYGYYKFLEPGAESFSCKLRTDPLYAAKANAGLICGIVFGSLAVVAIAVVLIVLWKCGYLQFNASGKCRRNRVPKSWKEKPAPKQPVQQSSRLGSKSVTDVAPLRGATGSPQFVQNSGRQTRLVL